MTTRYKKIIFFYSSSFVFFSLGLLVFVNDVSSFVLVVLCLSVWIFFYKFSLFFEPTFFIFWPLLFFCFFFVFFSVLIAQGYASYVFEKLKNGPKSLPGTGPFVAAFAQR